MNKTTPMMPKRKWTWWITVAAFALTGCGGDSATEPRVLEGYLVATSVPSADEFFTLVGAIPSLDVEAADLAGGAEYPGQAGLIRSPSIPDAYFIASEESPTIQRFDLGDNGVTPGRVLSMASLGLTYGPGPTDTAFGPDGLAYSVNYDNEVVVVWNPTTMEIERSIDLPGLTRDGYSSVGPISIIVRDGFLLFPVSYGNFETGAGLPLTVLGALELATGEVTLTEDTRCSGIRSLVSAPDGALYGATDGFFATRRRLYGEVAGTEPCILRVQPGEQRFDISYFVKSSALVDAAIVGDLSISADGARFIFYVFDEMLSPISPDAAYRDVARAPGWRLYQVPVSSVAAGTPAGAQPIAGLSAGARQGVRFNVDGRTWISLVEANFSASTLYDVSNGVEARRGPRFPGSVATISKLE
jgi:hypothetical protein